MDEESISVSEAIELLFNRESMQAAIQAEEKSDCDVAAGLDWGSEKVFVGFLKNPDLKVRLTCLRVSLNREIRLLLAERNLGVGEDAAFQVARSRLLSRLQSPLSTAIPVLEGILARRDLYAEQYIQNHEVLRDLLHEVLNYEDWEEIASAAARAVRERVLNV
ncbi:MAG: hypothetical protein ACYTXT_35670 [Nostoc sp.]